MTKVYFVRHAQPEHTWEDDRTRPLTEDGKRDSGIVLEFLKDKKIDVFYCGPYKRSMDTIAKAADFFGKEIITDERLREREKRDKWKLSWNVSKTLEKSQLPRGRRRIHSNGTKQKHICSSRNIVK